MNALWLKFFLDRSTKFNIIFIYFSARLGGICCDDFTFFGNSVFVMVVEQGQIWKHRQSPQKGRLNKLPLFLYMNQSMNVSRVIQSWNERKKCEKPKKNPDFVMTLYSYKDQFEHKSSPIILSYDVKTLCVSILRLGTYSPLLLFHLLLVKFLLPFSF